MELSARIIDYVICDGLCAISYWAGLDNSNKDWKETRKRLKEKNPDLCLEDTALELIHNGNGIILYDIENEEETWRLTKGKMILAWEVLKEEYPRIYANFCEGDYDADDCDIFIQLSLFGEIVFG